MSQTAERVRWTVRDLEVLPQSKGTRYELISGELFVPGLPYCRHHQVSGTILQPWMSGDVTAVARF